jgi:hypothetical protein
MNKQELIKRISELPYSEGPIADIVTVNRNWILESIEQLDKPQEVTIPQFVADYIKYAIENDWDFQDLFKRIEDEEDEELLRWVYHERNQETLAAAWINGYTVEKEKRYLVKMKGVDSRTNYLYYGVGSKTWLFKAKLIDGKFRKSHTRKELEQDNFGWVFDCPGIEIEEVK